MPGMDGFETIAKLQANEDTRDIPVIFISALGDIEDKVRGFQAGAVDYVSKPFRREEVIARVTTHLRLRQALAQVELERQKAHGLLLNVIPPPVAEELSKKGAFAPQLYPDVSVLFSDFVDFTQLSSTLSPGSLLDELNTLFTAFDEIMDHHGCERIKTVGDAYIAVGGMHDSTVDHPTRITRAALEMRDFVGGFRGTSEVPWKIRIGVHTGELIGGIVGVKKYLFDIFGDTVNIASRMESLCDPMQVTVSDVHAQRIQDVFDLELRPPVAVKGKGTMGIALVRGIQDQGT
jgi:class 3 adenylate cyclase